MTHGSPQAAWEAGEYYYELFGTSSPPLPLETYKMQVERARSWLESRGAGPRPLPPDYIVYGKGDGKGANRSGTNGALERQGDRRSSAVPKLGGLPPQAPRGAGAERP
eukprot:Skav210690  [mRNA]  locus=scaffold346:144481:146248:+ [translate_table: standard]